MEHAVFGRQNKIAFSNFDCKGEFSLRNGSGAIVFDDVCNDYDPIIANLSQPKRTGDILDMKTVLNGAGLSSLDGMLLQR